MRVLRGNRLLVFDEKGNLVEERDATLEDLIRYLIENLELEVEIPNVGKAKGKLKKVGV